MALGTEILLKIRGMFDSKAVDDAKKKTEELGKASEKAGKDASTGMNVMAAATAMMQGNFTGAVSAIAPLIERLKAFKGEITKITIFAAGFAAFVKLWQTLKEAADAAAQRLENIKTDNMRNQVEKAAKAYNDLVSSMERASKLADAQLEHDSAMIDANKRLALSIVEISKQRELSTAKTDDDKRAIEARYKATAQGISGSYDEKKSQAEYSRLLEKEKEIRGRIAAADARVKEATDEASKGLRSSFDAQSVSMKAIPPTSMGSIGAARSWYGGGQTKFKTWQDIANNRSETVSKSIEAARAAEKEKQAAMDELENIRGQQEVAQINMVSAGKERYASTMSSQREARDVQGDIVLKAQRKKLENQRDSLNKAQRDAEERFKIDSRVAGQEEFIAKSQMDMTKTVWEETRKKGDKKKTTVAYEDYVRKASDFDEADKRVKAIAEAAERVSRGYTKRLDAVEEILKRLE